MMKKALSLVLALVMCLGLLPMTALADNSTQISQVEISLDTGHIFLGSPLPQATTTTPNVTLRTEWRYCPDREAGAFESMELVLNNTASRGGWYWAEVTVSPSYGYTFTADCTFTTNGSSPAPLAGHNPVLFAVEALKMPPMLSTLNVSSGTLDPSFDCFILGDYTVNVGSSIDSITVTAATVAGYTVKGDGTYRLNVGENLIQVIVEDNSGEYEPAPYTLRIHRAQPQQPAKSETAMPTNDKLTVNGELANPTVYKINGNNYFKIRDVAALLNSTEKQFAVGYDNALKSVTATTGQGYDKLDDDLAGAPAGGDQIADPSNDTIYVNGKKIDATVYKIGGSNYFKLRDLGENLNFFVDWNRDQGMIIDTSKPYSE